MRRWIALALALMLCACALAEDLGALSDYLAAVTPEALGAQAWTREAGGRVLWLSPSTDAMVSLCAEGDRLLAISVTAPKGDARARLARLALPPGGWNDGQQLEARLESGEGGAMNGVRLTLLEGDLRQGAYLCAEGALEELVWQPLHGGEDRHRSPVCSGMDVPRLISPAAADALGLPPCRKCMKQ